jgi:hypothetical protein
MKKLSLSNLPSAEALVACGVMLLAFGAPWAQGCQYRYGWSALAMGSAALLLAVVFSRVSLPSEPRVMRWVWWGLFAIHALQLLPLPPVFAYTFAPLKAGFMEEAVSAGAWVPLSANIEATRNNLIVLGACYLAFRLGLGLFSHRHRIEYLGWVLLGSVFLISLYGFSELRETDGLHPGRMRGTYTNPNRFAGFLEMALPLGGLSAWLRWRALRTPMGSSRAGFEKAMHRAMIFVCGVALWLTGFFALTQTYSRMGFVGFVFGGIAAAFLLYRREKGVGVALAVCTALAVVAATGLSFGMDALFQRYNATLNSLEVSEGRWQIWSSAVGLFRDHWLLGGGSGAFRSLFKHYQSPELQGFAKFAENDYLNAACDLGLIGFALLMTGLVYFLFRMNTSGVHERRPHLVGLTWGICAIALHSITDFNLQEPANAWLFSLLMGAAFGLVRNSGTGIVHKSEIPTPIHPAAGTLWALVQTGLTAWLLWMGYQLLSVECYWPEPGSVFREHTAADEDDRLTDTVDWVMSVDPYYSAPLLKQAESLINAAAKSDDALLRESYYTRAEGDVQAALHLDPLNQNARFMLAQIYLTRTNGYREARHQTALAYRIAPAYPGLALMHFQMEIHGWRRDGRPGGVLPKHVLSSAARALSADPTQLRPVLTLLILATPYDPNWDAIIPASSSIRLEYARWLSGQGLRAPAGKQVDGALELLKRELAEESDAQKRELAQTQRETDAALVCLKAGQQRRFEELARGVLERQPEATRAAVAAQMVRREWERWPGIGSFFAGFFRSEYEREAWAHELSGDDAMQRESWRVAEAAYLRANELQVSPERFLKIAQALKGQRQNSRALLALGSAAALGARDPALRLEVAEWMYRCGDTPQALKELSKIAADFPDRASICAERRKSWSK